MTKTNLIKEIQQPAVRNKIFYWASIFTLFVAAILIILGILAVIQNNKQQSSLDEQNRKVTELVQEVKKLSEQNKSLAESSVNYSYCNSMLFSAYTQNLQPIVVEDLNKCVYKSFPNGVSNLQSATTNTAPKQSGYTAPQAQSQSAPTTQNRVAPGNSSNTPSNSNATPPQPNSNANEPLIKLGPLPTLPNLQISTPCLNVTGFLQAC